MRRDLGQGWFFVLLLLLLVPAGVLPAQVVNGSISGRVFDPAGRVIPDAQVTVVNKQRGTVRVVTADATGNYSLIGLAPAVYTISVSASGFAEQTRPGVLLAVDAALNLDFHLTVGGPNARIEVSAPVSYLQTGTPDVGSVIDQDLIETLPLNARNFLQLALLAPGAFPPVEGSQLSANGSTSMEVNGGREEFNNFLLDGVDNNDPYVNGYVVEPPVDSVQEFKMVASTYEAEYGRSAAGQINVVTRRGTNDFHATGYEYLRNKVLEARNYFDTEAFAKTPYIRNQFGAAGGGPIRKDKTFFFANTDFLRERLGLSQQSLVPTDDERKGNLSALGTAIFNPLTGAVFQGGIIPAGDISPIATDILKLYPEPNLTGSGSNYLGQPVQPTNHTGNTFRGDHQLSRKDDLTLRYAQGITNEFQPYPAGVAGAAPGFGDYIDDHTHNAMVREQHSFGTNAINSLIFGYNRFSRDFNAQNDQTNVGALWNVSWLNIPPRDYGYPIINVSGFSEIGDSSSFPDLRHTNTYQIADSLTFMRGRNTFKVGVDLRRLQLYGRLDLYERGALTFSEEVVGPISGSSISDLLLGYPALGIQSQSNNPIHLRSMSYDTYFQDDWRVRRNLVLSLGGRYEFNSPATDPANAMSELNLQTGQVVQVGTNGVSDSGISPDYKNFAPRAGVEWQAAPNFVVRAGYGVFYDAGMFVIGSSAYYNPPQFTVNVFLPLSGLLTLQNPFPSGGLLPSPDSLSTLSPSIITPYLQQWNFTTEGNLGRRGTVTLSYVGSGGSHLIRERDLNQPLAGSSDAVQSRRPYPQYGSIFYVETQGASNFNALEAHFTGRVAPGVSLWGAYTYSHSIDDSSAFLGDTADPNFPQNSHNLPGERGPSSFDIRQRFVGAYVLTLPHSNRWTRNTEFQGIAQAETGQPFTPTISFDNSNTGNTNQQSGADRPNRVGNPYQSGSIAANSSCTVPKGSTTHTAAQWFNPCAFAVAAPNSYGNAGRNSLLGPGYGSFDISLLRRFTLPERATLTLEAQSFNLFNRPNLALPAAVTDQPSAGIISSASDPRELQFAARLSF